jgi:beta-lactamase class A
VKRSLFLGGAGGLLLSFDCARSARSAQDDNAANLRLQVEKIAKKMPGAIGVCAMTLSQDDPMVAYRAYESFPTASTIKVLIMATAYATDELQPGTLDTRIRFDKSELIAGSDFMKTVSDGTQLTVRDLLVPMITISDNTAANMLIGYFGVDAINNIGLQAGLEQTHLQRKFLDWYAIVKHEDNVSSPGDMAKLLSLIETGAHEGTHTIAAGAHCRTMVDIMLGQTDRDGIPAALPAGTQIANKTGEIEGTRNDVAIVKPFGDSPLILAIMTKSAYNYPASYDAMHAIARAVYRSSTLRPPP